MKLTLALLVGLVLTVGDLTPPPADLVPLPPPKEQTATPYAAWENGPPANPDFFPIAVWLQAPPHAQRYLDAGINVYIGLWEGPTEEQLAQLTAAGMKVICDQNEVGLQHLEDPTIIGWMHGDEPDNAQSLGKGKGYGPPVPPAEIVAGYERMVEADPTRPVWLNLGQGVAWDGWIGRGVRTNHPEDYPEYIQGCDVASFDIYPAVHGKPEVAGNLWYVARGVHRLRDWGDDRKIVWNCIETTRINNPDTKPTPHQVRAEVWMSIVHGSRGLIYFAHEFQPRFVEAGLLADAEMLAAVTKLNREIHSLSAVINGPTVKDGAKVKTDPRGAPIHTLVKEHDGATYVFAVMMHDQEAEATFQVRGVKKGATVEVLGEDRTLEVKNRRFTDTFAGYDVHLYRIR